MDFPFQIAIKRISLVLPSSVKAEHVSQTGGIVMIVNGHPPATDADSRVAIDVIEINLRKDQHVIRGILDGVRSRNLILPVDIRYLSPWNDGIPVDIDDVSLTTVFVQIIDQLMRQFYAPGRFTGGCKDINLSVLTHSSSLSDRTMLSPLSHGRHRCAES